MVQYLLVKLTNVTNVDMYFYENKKLVEQNKSQFSHFSFMSAEAAAQLSAHGMHRAPT